MIEGIDYVFIDTAPTMWVVVQEAIRAATLVLIPARPGFFDLAAVRETVKIARERDKPLRGRDQRRAGEARRQGSRRWSRSRAPISTGCTSRCGRARSASAPASSRPWRPARAPPRSDRTRRPASRSRSFGRAVERAVEAINDARFEPGQAANSDATTIGIIAA